MECPGDEGGSESECHSERSGKFATRISRAVEVEASCGDESPLPTSRAQSSERRAATSRGILHLQTQVVRIPLGCSDRAGVPSDPSTSGVVRAANHSRALWMEQAKRIAGKGTSSLVPIRLDQEWRFSP